MVFLVQVVHIVVQALVAQEDDMIHIDSVKDKIEIQGEPSLILSEILLAIELIEIKDVNDELLSTTDKICLLLKIETTSEEDES